MTIPDTTIPALTTVLAAGLKLTLITVVVALALALGVAFASLLSPRRSRLGK